MAQETGLKVKLIAYTSQPEATVTAAIRQCYSAVGAEELQEKTNKVTQERLIGQITASGHTSTIEHAAFTFAIEGISRTCSHQLVRHRIASFSQQSQRYVDLSKKGMCYIVPPQIKAKKASREKFKKLMEEVEENYCQLIKSGLAPEDARFLLPNACETKIVVTMNARSLANFFRLRTCRRAQWEIRALAEAMMKLAKEAAPLLFANVGPSCQTEKICWEGNLSCGLWKTIPGAVLKERL
jgi:thymidylate synthase (FAD)